MQFSESIDDAGNILMGLEELHPHQDARERRRIRERYHKLIVAIRGTDDAPPTVTGSDLQKHMTEGSVLFDQVRTVSESILDSNFMKLCATACRREVEGCSANKCIFSNAEYAEKLITFANKQLGSDCNDMSPDGWLKYGKNVTSSMAYAPRFGFMHGRFSQESPERPIARIRPHAKFENVATNTISKITCNNDAQNKGSAEIMADLLMSVLLEKYRGNGRKPLPYFAFILDPHSFGKSIENIFYSSFLFRDGCAALYKNARNEYMIAPACHLEKTKQSEKKVRHQTVVELDEGLWCELCKFYTVEEPMVNMDTAQLKN